MSDSPFDDFIETDYKASLLRARPNVRARRSTLPPPNRGGKLWFIWDEDEGELGEGDTEAEAWADAYSKIQESYDER